jgi:hypothetical protein
VIFFGPQIIGLFGGVFKQHWMLLSGAILELGLVLWLLARARKSISKKNAAPPSENDVETQHPVN